MKRMLINATQEEELRVALVDGQYLFNLDIQSTTRLETKANIYKGKISRLEPSLEAAFVNYGADKHGFLPLKEIPSNLFKTQPEPGQRINIKDVLDEGMEIIVQVEKEERGNKGAALTSYISLAGCYLVLMPNNPKAGGISRRVEREDRDDLKEILNNLVLPEDMGVIVRTAGVGKSQPELQWDLDSLLKQWVAIKEASEKQAAPFLIHQESDIITRSVRDYLREDVGEILIDNASVFEATRDYTQMLRPDFVNKVKFYNEATPLFSHYQIERQIESAFKREIQLPSGGSIVIDHTEALISIDINSARANKGVDIEETALQTNLEAADEIARQLRMRDLGGLIVIDFIDMTPVRNQRAVEDRLREAVAMDRARIQSGSISRFGLLEMSRQRLRPSLREGTQHICPRCDGQGMIRSVESLALSILRLLGEEAVREKKAQIRVLVPINVASFLLNEKKQSIAQLEKNYEVSILVLPRIELETPHYTIERVKSSDFDADAASYQIEYHTDVEESKSEKVLNVKSEVPAVQSIVREKPPETIVRIAPSPKKKPGLFQRIISALLGKKAEAEIEEERKTRSGPYVRRNNNNGRYQQRRGPYNGQRPQGSYQQRNRNDQQRTPRPDANRPAP
jgi:ribonuclease E